MVLDFAAGKISYVDYVGFLQSTDRDYMDISNFPTQDNDGNPFLMQCTRTMILYGDMTHLDLKEYNIPMVAQDGKYLLPLQTLSAFFFSPNGFALYFNGEGIFYYAISKMMDPYSSFETNLSLSGLATPDLLEKYDAFEGTREEKKAYLLELVRAASPQGAQLVEAYEKEKDASLYLKYQAVPDKPRSKALINYGYNELCLEMDCFYGLKDSHHISDFNTFLMQSALVLGLSDPDAAKADAAISEMVKKWLDDKHSSYVSSSCYSASDPEVDRGFGVELYASLHTRLTSLKQKHPESLQPYYEVGNTAFVTMDNFAANHTGDINGFANYYKLAEEGKLQDDTIGLIIKAHEQITRENSPIKNVVLDLSRNTGGEVTTALYMLGWLLGEGNACVRNTFTGAQKATFVRSDVNMDRQFDEKDTLLGRDLRVYCLISPVSFSCGNLVPCALKSSGEVALIGRTSGGGSCIVGSATTAWGTSFNISSYNSLSYVKNGAYYDVDLGADPDYFIGDYERFYDREALAEYINGLY